jgi:CBS-domain-containing membrane protein
LIPTPIKTLHPPWGAAALIAVLGGEKAHALGYLYGAIPHATCAAILLVPEFPRSR